MDLTEVLSVYAIEEEPLLLIRTCNESQWQCHNVTQLERSFKKLTKGLKVWWLVLWLGSEAQCLSCKFVCKCGSVCCNN